MSKRIGFVIGALALVGVAAAGMTVSPAAASQEPQTQPVCTLPGKAKYSPGAVVKHEGQIYRCYFVYGDEMVPGVAWLKMEQILTSKESTIGR